MAPNYILADEDLKKPAGGEPARNREGRGRLEEGEEEEDEGMEAESVGLSDSCWR